MATLITEESKGQIIVKSYRQGSLYVGTDFQNQMSMGTMDMGVLNLGYLQAKTAEFVPWTIAYTWKSPEHMYAVAASREWYKSQLELYVRDWNAVPLYQSAYGNWDYWARKPIRKIEDFAGLRFWSYGELANRYLASWGATGQILAQAEEYMAYYRGALDGVSGSSVVYFDYKYYECGKYWLHMPTYPPGSTGFHYNQNCFAAKKWATLPEAYKKIIIDANCLVGAAGIWEIICQERTCEWRLVHEKGMIDLGIATQTPAEYKRICDAAVAAGETYAVVTRKIPKADFDAVVAFKAAKGDPTVCADYTWWYTAAWAEADRRVSGALVRIKAGEDENAVWDSYHGKRLYNMSYADLKAELISIPRIVWDWPMEWMLAGKPL
jgi:TRAP-type C4-dicarboxylate transport system substrate-binding protein